jgi:putative DNA primase/helicase
VICEGIETGLAILQATGLHVWVALGSTNLGNVEMPAFVDEIIIAADHDEPGLRAARAAEELYKVRGFRVRIVSPETSGMDFNDLLRR